MRKTALALIAVAGVAAVVAAPTASAFATRSSVHESNKGTNHQGNQGNQGNQGSDQDGGYKGSDPNGSSTSVPEPGTLMLLAAGVTAIGGAALRRRRLKKD